MAFCNDCPVLTPLVQYRAVMNVMYGADLAAMLADDPLASPLASAMTKIAAPELETCMIDVDGMVHGRETGVEGWLAGWRAWLRAFDHFTLEESDEPIVHGDVLVGFSVQRGTVPDSDFEVTAAGTGVWFFEDGHLRRLELHLDRDRALRVAGLDPELHRPSTHP